jgi:hypothetical protein
MRKLIGYLSLTLFVEIILALIIIPSGTLQEDVFLSPPNRISFSFISSVFVILVIKDILLLIIIFDHKFKLKKMIMQYIHKIR